MVAINRKQSGTQLSLVKVDSSLSPEEQAELTSVEKQASNFKSDDDSGKINVVVEQESDSDAPELVDSLDSIRNIGMFFCLALLVGVFGHFIFTRNSVNGSDADLATEQASYVDLWQSGQPSLMAAVAKRAIIDNDKVAQSIIVKDVMSGKKPQRVKTELLKTAFNPDWEADLTDEDRKTALILSTAGLLGKDVPQLPSLHTVHPAILLAITGTLPVDAVISDFSDISLQRMTDLPNPYNLPFRELQKIKPTTLQDTSVRALSHILLGERSDTIVSRYFGEMREDAELFRKLRVLMSILDRYPGFDIVVYTHLISRSKVFAQAYRWFDEEPFAQWDGAHLLDKLSIVAGLYPKSEFTFEQYGDLLRFPNTRIASIAAEQLNTRFYQDKINGILAFLVSDNCKLTRYQTIKLLAALQLKGDEARTFHAKWFQSEPDVSSTLALLLLRSDAGKDDRFNILASQYLTSKNWQAPLKTLRQLVAHPEPLARALAYSHLRKDVPEELEILKNMSFAEPNKILKEAIQSRLRD